MTWRAGEYEAFKREERRLRLLENAADQATAVQRNKEIEMSMKTTSHGDKVPRFPDVGGRGKRIAEVRKVLAEAFEKAERAAALNARMDAAKTVDAARFPVLGDQS